MGIDINEYIPLARTLAWGFQRKYERYSDEFESASMWGLFEAWRKYVDEKMPFRLFAHYYIRQRLIDTEREINKHLYYNRAIEIEAVGDDREEGDGIEVLLSKLPLNCQRVCRMIYKDEMVQREIAEVLGIHPMAVSRLHIKSLAKLRITEAHRYD